MAVLFREDLLAEIQAGRLFHGLNLDDPEDMVRVQSASVDLQIGNSGARYPNQQGMVSSMMPRRLTDITKADFERFAIEQGLDFVIGPREFILLETDLTFDVPNNLAVYIEGKSTVGRTGLFVVNAGFVEPGFQGTITLELFNSAPFPILLVGGDLIAQAVAIKGSRATQYPYGKVGLRSRYQGQLGVTPPRRQPGPYGALVGG